MSKADFFLELEGIKGESPDDSHKEWIECLSWSWGETQSGTMHGMGGSGGGAGKVSMQDFHFTTYMNKASPSLMQYCASGKHIKSAQFAARKAGDNPMQYLLIKFTDILISSYQVGGSEGGLTPVDQISFNFGKIEMEYKPQKEDGTLGGSVFGKFDVTKNKAG